MGWKNLLKVLSVMDVWGELGGMAQDVHYNVTSSEGKTTIFLSSGDLPDAKRALNKAGIKVVSTCGGGYDPESGIDVPDSQASEARDALGSISNW